MPSHSPLRRRLLQASAGMMAGAFLGWPARVRATSVTRWQLSGVDDLQGNHFVALLHRGQLQARLALPVRVHGGAVHPNQREAVVMARRPGTQMFIIDLDAARLRGTAREAGSDRHYFGHAVYSADGQWLYVTENDYTNEAGVIGIYDVQRDYAKVAEWSSGGLDPHELVLTPDHQHLLICNGGILTHPDYERIKLNVDSMAPNLTLLDRRTGQIQQQWTPSHHQLSCRHLAIHPDGTACIGFQYEGPQSDTRPIMALLDLTRGRWQEQEAPTHLSGELRHYMASVAVDPVHDQFVLTAPRGGYALFWDKRAGRWADALTMADVAGAVHLDAGTLLISSGTGHLLEVDTTGRHRQRLLPDTRWDNHLFG